jgi:class 3 adenylate cyclase
LGGLELGDQLIRVGSEDLRGVWPIGLLGREFKEADALLRVPVVFVRAGHRQETLLSLRREPLPWRFVPIAISFVTFAVLLLLQKPGSPLIRAIFLASMTVSFRFTYFNGGPFASLWLTYTWAGLDFVARTIWFPLLLREALLFPQGSTRAESRLPAWPWLFAIAGPLWCGWMYGATQLSFYRASLIVNVIFIITFLSILGHHFVLSDPIGRRQIKWVLYATYIACVPQAVLLFLMFLNPLPSVYVLLASADTLFLFVPLGIFIAIVRYNLFDIDRLISATTAYTIVSVFVIAAALALVPHLSETARKMVGLSPTASELLTSLLLATVAVPGSRYLRPQIERSFFAERYALEQGMEHLLRELSLCDGPQALLTLAGERLDTLLQPESCVVYGRSGENYAPVFILGRAVPPTIEVGVAFIIALRSEAAPVETERWLRTSREFLRPIDHAVLASIGATVLIPVSPQGSPLAAFLCLGPKRSGDIYTTTDLALLTAVGVKVSAELQRFDEAEIALQARAMQDALRRYVPEQVAAQVISGRNLNPREREVSVLFVDIRGYTSYAEEKSAAEVFSTVNRYTETVSRVVRAHGGTVVEFNGDGMMSVFGAPEPLADKELSAVVTGLEIVAAVRALSLGATEGAQRSLEVGVGIATGKAFVGNIRSADRLIWTAIGDTTNLAARLQGLTRELDAAILIDAATMRNAGDAASDFERRERVTIRGRRQTEDVYVLLLTGI